MEGKKGVLLVNLGTPDDPSRGSVYRYLLQFLTDPRVIDYPWLLRQILVRGIIVPFRSGSSSKLYKQLWTEEGSPLKFYGERLTAGVIEHLGDDYEVELAMRYQNPSIESAIERLLKKGVKSFLIFPLFPQYASASTGSVHEEVMRIFSAKQVIPDIKMINSYFDHPAMVKIFADNARKFDIKSYDHILFSYHGLPARHLRKGDPTGSHCKKVENCCAQMGEHNKYCYSAQCYQTTYAIAEELGLKPEDYSIAFQSRLGKEEWQKPYSDKVIEQRAKKGDKKMLVFCPAFVADCLETTIEVSYEYKEEFLEMGGEIMDLVPSLNDNPDWIKAVSEMVEAEA